MKLEILIVSRSQGGMEVFARMARKFGFATRSCDDAYEALDRLAEHEYAAVIQDLDLPGAESVLRFVHMIPSAKRSVAFALVSARMHVANAYQWGANFVLYKPLQEDQVLRMLRAGRGFMHAERRQSSRQPLRQLLHFDLPGEVCCPALLLDVSESGMAIQTIGPLPLSSDLPFRLELPQGVRIRGLAETVWTDSRGRAGLAFAQLSLRDQHSLELWLRRQNHGGLASEAHPATSHAARIAT